MNITFQDAGLKQKKRLAILMPAVSHMTLQEEQSCDTNSDRGARSSVPRSTENHGQQLGSKKMQMPVGEALT